MYLFDKYFCKNLGQQDGNCERETGPPEEGEGLEDEEGCEGQQEAAGEEGAPELSVGEEDDQVGQQEDLEDGWDELPVLTDWIPANPVESQTIAETHQLGQQSPQLEPLHPLLPVDPGDLGRLGEEGGGDHQVTQEGRELGDHRSVTAPLPHWAVPYITATARAE